MRRSPPGGRSVVAVVAAMMLIAGLGAASVASDRAMTVTSIQQVIDHWQPDQHLFVQGDLGLSEHRLRELEQWLDEHGQNWTIVLIHNSEGETYTAPDGGRFTGIDAVEHALERGLQDRTGYGRLEHPVTGERYGCAFLLSLQDRSFTYYSSDAQDRRGLGKSNWRGRLDRPAYRAMRSGGRIVAAVQDTVSSINKALAQRIQSEQAASERVRRERERAVAELGDQMTEVRASIERVVQASQSIVASHPTATGALARPPVGEWHKSLSHIEDQLTPDTVRRLQQELSGVRSEVDRYLNGLQEYGQFETRAAALKEKIQLADTGPNRVGVPLWERAKQALNTAEASYANAQWNASQQLQEGERLLEQAAGAVAQERHRLLKAAARARRIQMAGIQMAVAFLLVAAAALVYLNRRRRPVRDAAVEQLEARQQRARQMLDEMFDLMQRTHVVIGKKHDLARRGCEGETRRLSEQTIADIDNLFVMSRSVDRVIEQASGLIRPSSWWSSVGNLFRQAPYRQAKHLLTDQPIRFQPEEGLPLPSKSASEPQRELFGDLHDCKGFEWTFEELLHEFERRAQRAKANLDVVEHCWGNLAGAMDAIQQQVTVLEEREAELQQAAATDGCFNLEPLFEQLLPAALTQHDAAEALGSTDPVGAMQGPIAIGTRQVEEARMIVEAITDFRQHQMPTLRQHQERLQQAGHQVAWADEALGETSEKLRQLIIQAVEQSVRDPFGELSGQLTELTTRVEEILEQVDRYRTESEPQLAASHQRLDATRTDLSEAIGVAALEVLREEGLDPDLSLRDAQRQLSAAKAAIDRGAVPAAVSALDELLRLDKQANDIITATVRGFESHEGEIKRLWHKADHIFAKHAHHELLLERLVHEYAPDALLIHWADPDFADGDATVAHHADDAQQWMSDARRALDLSNDDFRAAHILKAAQRRAQAESWLDQVDRCYEQIQQQSSCLVTQVKNNARRSSSLTRRGAVLEQEAQDMRTRASTQTRLQEALRSLQHGLRLVHAPVGQRSPFAADAELTAAESLLDEVEQWLQTDRDLHAEAVRSVEDAKQQLVAARELVGVVRTDQVPDSTSTMKMVQSVEELATDCEQLQQHITEPHLDWATLDEQADALTRALAGAIAHLRGELQKGRAAMQELESAASHVRRATGWSSMLGVTIPGTPGSDLLHHSRSALGRGDYDQALHLASQAAEAALEAVRRAEAEVRARRRQAERKSAAARRRRNRSTWVGSNSSSIGFGSGNSFGGSSSIGSGSRSGFSSGSSFSRSGW